MYYCKGMILCMPHFHVLYNLLEIKLLPLHVVALDALECKCVNALLQEILSKAKLPQVNMTLDAMCLFQPRSD